MLQIIQHSGITFGLYSGLFDMIFSPEGVVSSQDYEYQIKPVSKMVSIRTIDLEQLIFANALV